MEVKLTTKQLDGFSTEGTKAFRDMDKMAETLGYGSSLGNPFDAFLADNPGAVEAAYDWVRLNYASQIEKNDAQAQDNTDKTDLVVRINVDGCICRADCCDKSSPDPFAHMRCDNCGDVCRCM